MKRIIKIISTSIFALFFVGANAQELYKSWINLPPESNSLNHKLTGKKYYIIPSSKGSKCLTEQWCIGNVVLENGDRHDSLNLKLDSYIDEIIQYNEHVGSAIMLDKSTISSFSFAFEDGHTEQFRKIYFDRYPKGDRYFSILHEGKLMVLLWYKTIDQKTTLYADALGIMHDSKYILTKSYYIVFPDNEMVKLKLKRRSFLELFPEQKKQVRRIIRKNNIQFETEKDMIRAISLVEKELL